MVQDGVVVELVGTDAVVQFSCSSEKCGHCKACSGFGGDQAKSITLRNSIGAGVGEIVAIDMPERSLLGATAILYIIPLLLLLTGMAAAKSFGASDGIAAICALLSAGLSYAIIRLLEPRFKSSRIFAPKMSWPDDGHEKLDD